MQDTLTNSAAKGGAVIRATNNANKTAPTNTETASFTRVETGNTFELTHALNRHLTTSQHVQAARITDVQTSVETALKGNDTDNMKKIAEICENASRKSFMSSPSELNKLMQNEEFKNAFKDTDGKIDQASIYNALMTADNNDKKEAISAAILADLESFAKGKSVSWCKKAQESAFNTLGKNKLAVRTLGGYRQSPQLGKPPGMLGKIIGQSIIIDPVNESVQIKGSMMGNKGFAQNVFKGMVASGLLGENVTIELETSSNKMAQDQIKQLVAEAQKRGIPLSSITVTAPRTSSKINMTLDQMVKNSKDKSTQPGENFGLMSAYNLNQTWGKRIENKENKSGLNQDLRAASYNAGSLYLDDTQSRKLQNELVSKNKLAPKNEKTFEETTKEKQERQFQNMGRAVNNDENKKDATEIAESAVTATEYKKLPDRVKKTMLESLQGSKLAGRNLNQSIKAMNKSGVAALNTEIQSRANGLADFSRAELNTPTHITNVAKSRDGLKKLIQQQKALAGKPLEAEISDKQLDAFLIQSKNQLTSKKPDFSKVKIVDEAESTKVIIQNVTQKINKTDDSGNLIEKTNELRGLQGKDPLGAQKTVALVKAFNENKNKNFVRKESNAKLVQRVTKDPKKAKISASKETLDQNKGDIEMHRVRTVKQRETINRESTSAKNSKEVQDENRSSLTKKPGLNP